MALFVSGKLFNKANVGEGGGGDQHNLGWYATESALTTAHPTATDGDWAIIGSTDTVWVWDTDTTAWKDTGAAGIELPDQTGNAGKFLVTNGTSASWGGAVPLNSDGNVPIRDLSGSILSLLKLNDSGTFINFKKTNSLLNGIIGSLSVYDGELSFSSSKNGQVKSVFGTNETCFYAYARNNNGADYDLGQANHVFSRTYTKKINNGSDITVPAVGGALAVKQVNTTITLTSAGWSSNTQTVNVTGMTATGLVFVSPVPTDQSAYTSAGIICSAQAAGTLTFTCTSVPSGNISVSVVML